MNSEELEQSLRAEFENYLKDVVAEIRQGVSDFQEKINADFDKHKEQLAESLRELDQKVGSDKELEVSFTETVAEHLKLARDEGASVTAAAIAEAEKLAEPEDEGPDFFNLSQAIDDISRKDSQSEILKALVNHAAEFTPRGAFFIVKNEHLVGWRVFGKEEHEDPKVVREVFFPVATNTALSASVERLSTVSETGHDSEDDVMYRNKLGFENPERMYAVPLIARGRGVAVLYADNGTEGHNINIAAIEALMRVAGLTVEVLASAPQVSRPKEEEVPEETYTEPSEADTNQLDHDAMPAAEEAADTDFTNEYPGDSAAVEQTVESEETDSYQFQPVAPVADFEPVAETSESAYEEVAEEPVVAEEATFESGDISYEAPVAEYQEAAPEAEYEEAVPETAFEETAFDSGVADETAVGGQEGGATWEQVDSASDSTETYSADESFTADESFSAGDSFPSDFESADEPATAFEAFDAGSEEPFGDAAVEAEEVAGYEFETAAEEPAFEEVAEDALSFEEPVADTGYEFEQPGEAAEEVAVEEPAPIKPVQESEPAAPPVRSRFADRNLDLPIEVGEDERRLHNDARRFARLLVSEIKLYNEQKVKEGRESSDLYERLREAIDRSREMYDKRVQPPVAAKFDYFNYELVNTLAEGDEGKLGGSYPGAAV